MTWRPVLAGLLAIGGALGCGTPPSPVDARASDECVAAVESAAQMWQAVHTLAAQRATPPEPSGANRLGFAALERLEAHLRSLRSAPREVEGEQAMALSSAMMDGIDEAGARLEPALRQRADDAAEQLLTDRGEQGSVRATRGAIALLEQVLSQSTPGVADAIAERRAAGQLARRSERVPQGYEESIERGDRLADRAEASPLPESASELRVRQETAAEASRDVRITCRVDRTLAVPGL